MRRSRDPYALALAIVAHLTMWSLAFGLVAFLNP